MTIHRVLLAGAGDLCQRAGRRLIAQGHQVWGLRRRPPDQDATGIQWLCADLSRAETLTGLPHAFSHVIYAPAPDQRDKDAYRTVFLRGMQNLVSRLDQHELIRFIFISSSAVYGDHGEQWVDENTPANPSGFNGQALVEAEQWLHRERPDATVFRLAGLYGPQRIELLTRLQTGQATVPRQNARWANRFHIDDAARATVHLLNLGQAEPFYIGSDNHPHKIHELYDALAAMLSVKAPADAAQNPAASGKRLNNARLRAHGFEPAWPNAIEGYRAIIKARATQPG